MVQCYFRAPNGNNAIQPFNSGICANSGTAAGFYSCCFPWDTCVGNSLCLGNTTYYTALCTDPTLGDSACSKACNDQHYENVQYNTNNNTWTCATGENFVVAAPPPNVLSSSTQAILDFIPSTTIPYSSTTASATASTTSASASASTSESTSASTSASTFSTSTTAAPGSTTTAVLSPNQNPVQATTSGLTTGAATGIGIGVALAVILLVVGVILLLRRSRRRRRTFVPETPAQYVNAVQEKQLHNDSHVGRDFQQTYPTYEHEVEGRSVVPELGGHEVVQELEAKNRV